MFNIYKYVLKCLLYEILLWGNKYYVVIYCMKFLLQLIQNLNWLKHYREFTVSPIRKSRGEAKCDYFDLSFSLFLWDIVSMIALQVWIIFSLAAFLVARWLLIITAAIYTIELKSQTTLNRQVIYLPLKHCVQVTALHWLTRAEVIFP